MLRVLWGCFCLGFLVVSTVDAAEAPLRPNILLIVADDLGWQDVGWHGGHFKTPELDELVRTGVELDRQYVQPVCTPTRTALLSGRWTSRFGPHALAPSNLRVFPPGTTTLASALKEVGYSTHIAGKWHLGSRLEWGPNRYGFDKSYGSLNGAVDPWTHLYRPGPYLETWHRDESWLKEEGNATELVAKEVLGWIRQHHEPWLIYVPFHAVHIPVDAPDEFRKLYQTIKFDDDPVRNDAAQRMGAFVSQLDAKVGDFVKALEDTQQRNNTLIVFTSDNGGKLKGNNPYVGDVGDSPILSSNEPLRGEKNQLFEGGIRVDAFANWPGHLQPRKIETPIHAVDWMPTLTHLAGWQPPGELQLDGQDIWPLLTGRTQTLDSRSIYIPHKKGAALIRDGWKLIEWQGKPDMLFQIMRDPSEKQDLAKSEPQKLADMKAELRRYRALDVKELPSDLRGLAP